MKNTSLFRHVALLLALCALLAANADTIYVDDALGSDEADGTSAEPLKTIAAGVAKAAPTDVPRTVVVRSGTYKIDSVIEIRDDVSVVSETGNPADVTVDGQGVTSIFKWTGWSAGNSRLQGLTICNGYLLSDGTSNASGVFMQGGTISNCVIRNCLATGNGVEIVQGGAVWTVAARDNMVPRILDSRICDNVASNACGTTASSVKGGGLYLGSGGAVVRGCTIEGNVAWINASVSTDGGLGVEACIGGGVYAVETSEISDCIVRNNVATNAHTKGYTGGGGGIYAAGSSIVSNCLVYGNVASCYGGGVAAAYNTVVSHCTITNNEIHAIRSNAPFVSGGGVALAGTDSKCLNCRVENNAIRGATSNTKSGGGAVLLSGTRSLVANCSVIDNSAHCGGAFYAGSVLAGSGADAVISNCLVRGNSASVNSGVLGYYVPQNVLMTDCVVVSNSAADRAVCYGYTAGRNCGGVKFRNSFFFGNFIDGTAVYGYGLFGGQLTSTYVQPLVIDHCTIVSNYATSGVLRMESAEVTNYFCYGSVIFGNRNRVSYVLLPTVNQSTLFAATTNAWYNFTDGNGFSSDAQYGNFKTLTSEAFVDQPGGDYRLKRDSGLIDKGGPVQDWMRGRNTFDMGDGTMTVNPIGKYGVEIVRNNAVRRLKDFPEPGCFELWSPLGFILSFE